MAAGSAFPATRPHNEHGMGKAADPHHSGTNLAALNKLVHPLTDLGIHGSRRVDIIHDKLFGRWPELYQPQLPQIRCRVVDVIGRGQIDRFQKLTRCHAAGVAVRIAVAPESCQFIRPHAHRFRFGPIAKIKRTGAGSQHFSGGKPSGQLCQLSKIIKQNSGAAGALVGISFLRKRMRPAMS